MRKSHFRLKSPSPQTPGAFLHSAIIPALQRRSAIGETVTHPPRATSPLESHAHFPFPQIYKNWSPLNYLSMYRLRLSNSKWRFQGHCNWPPSSVSSSVRHEETMLCNKKNDLQNPALVSGKDEERLCFILSRRPARLKVQYDLLMARKIDISM